MNAKGVNQKLSVIITGASGMVGEGVLLECLEHQAIERMLMVNRRPLDIKHPKLHELIVADFLDLKEASTSLTGYDACFYCAGISSRGMNEEDYSHITFDVTLHFARAMEELNPGMRFCYVSGTLTDSSEQGRIMWARVKGRTENALLKCEHLYAYNFRPGFMKPTTGQKNIQPYYRAIGFAYPLLSLLFPKTVSTMKEVGLAMIQTALSGGTRRILEIPDIKALAHTLRGIENPLRKT